MVYVYSTFLYNPLLNVLIFFYNTIAFGDFGLAIILFTIFIRLLLYPLFSKSARHQAVMQKLQPEIKKLEEKHKGDRERQGKEMMALYKEHNFNPFFGFIFLLVQIPILITLYRIFLDSLKQNFLSSGLYSFVARPPSINTSFLGLINLGEHNILMVGLAALAQYFQAYLALPRLQPGKEPAPAERMARQMVFLAPGITFFIFYNLPSAVSLYWLVATLFSVVQQIIINRKEYGTSGIIRTKNY